MFFHTGYEVENVSHMGQPSVSSVPENIQQICDLIKNNQWIMVFEINLGGYLVLCPF